MVKATMESHRHSKNCSPYRGLSYMCETFVKLRKGEGITITIHDILAFLCTFCGHGTMNEIKLPNGEVRSLGIHSMHNCSKDCCGRFLDRRFLQYTGGDCECGVIVMNQLGIRPAEERENEWRRDLFVGKGGGLINTNIKAKFATTFARLQIRKPQLLVWYLMSLGADKVNEILSLSEKERDKAIAKMVVSRNKEYGRHQPIQ